MFLVIFNLKCNVFRTAAPGMIAMGACGKTYLWFNQVIISIASYIIRDMNTITFAAQQLRVWCSKVLRLWTQNGHHYIVTRCAMPHVGWFMYDFPF
jgi:hypothetical protein